MNLQDQVVYRCTHAQCARLLPRRVNYCPYCGVSQQDGARAQPQPPVPRPVEAQPQPQSEPPIQPQPRLQPQPEPQPRPIEPPAPQPETVQVHVNVPPVPQPAPVLPVLPIPPAAPSALTDPAARAAAARGSPPPPPPPALSTPAPTVRGPAAPPQRKPIRMRWWILALIGLWAIWMITKPNTRKIEERVDNAVSLTRECKLGEAQGELIALRSGKADDAQLRRVQKAINDASSGCERKRVRARTWTETEVAVQKLIDDGQIAKAHARLSQFTRRHGEDADTRALKERIGPVPQPSRPKSTEPSSGQLARDVVSARNLIDQAERDIQAGNYQAASDKMDTCVTMVENGARECAAFKVYADRLQAEMRRCVASGMEWSNRRCQ